MATSGTDARSETPASECTRGNGTGVAENRFAFLFASLLALLLLHPLVTRGPFAAALGQALVAAILLTAVRAMAVSRAQLTVARIAVAASVLPGVASLVWPDPILGAAARLVAAAFLGWVCWLVTASVLRSRRVTGDTLYAAACGYQLLGVLFALAYAIMDAASPAVTQLSAATLSPSGAASLGDTIYFSFVTLTTVGYGDIHPTGAIARAMAPVEALAGQLYLAILIARLVGVHIAQATAGSSPR